MERDERESRGEALAGQDRREGTLKRIAPERIIWQSALYLLVLGLVCMFLIPLTSFWWVVPLFGALAPLALLLLRSSGPRPRDRTMAAASEREPVGPTATPNEPTLAPRGPAYSPGGTAPSWSASPEDRTRAGTGDGVPAAGQATIAVHIDDPLSARELEVLTVLATGKTTAEAARELFVSVGTIKSHTGNIYRKLGAKNRTEAVARARELGFLS